MDMCLPPDAFKRFLEIVGPRTVEELAPGFITVGERNTLWVWVAEHGMWCMQGIFG